MSSIRKKPLIIYTWTIWVLCFLAGVWLADIINIPLWKSGFLCILSLLIWLCWKPFHYLAPSLWLLFSAFWLGAWLYQSEKTSHSQDDCQKEISRYVGKTYWYEGLLEQPFVQKGKAWSSTLSLQGVTKQPYQKWRTLCGRIHVKIYKKTTISQGARIRARIRLRKPRRYANPGQRNPWKRYIRKGIQFQGSIRPRFLAQLEIVKSKQAPMLTIWIPNIRTQLKGWLKKQVDDPLAKSLMLAVLLGDKSSLTREQKQWFAKTGTSHLLAISGLHLAIFSLMIFFLVKYVLSLSQWFLHHFNREKWAALWTLPFALAYTLISGSSYSSQRAMWMISLTLAALILARKSTIFVTIAWAAFFITLIDPFAALSLSFQLSFSAVIVLVMSSRIFFQDKPWLQKTKPSRWRFIKNAMLASTVATLGTLPLTLSFSPYLALHSPIVNLVAVPIAGYFVVGFGLLGMFSYFISPTTSSLLLQFSAQSASLLNQWIAHCSQAEFAIFKLSAMNFWETLVYIMMLLAIWLRSVHKGLAKSILILSITIFIMQWYVHQHQATQQRLSLHFIDVGQGDATLIRFPNGKTMQVDAGGEGFTKIDVAERSLIPYFRHLRIKQLDYAVLSHPHPDHFGGFIGLLKAYPSKVFWHTGESGHHSEYKRFTEVLKKQNIPTKIFRRPYRENIGGVQVDVLYPFPGPYEGKSYYWALHANDNSMVIRLKYKQITILLTGDIEKRAEELLTQKWPNLRADLIKVPHHGSKTSSTARLLDHVKPRHAVVSCGRSNIFRFPHKEVLRRYRERNIQLWRTDMHGRVRVSTDGEKLFFHTHLQVKHSP